MQFIKIRGVGDCPPRFWQNRTRRITPCTPSFRLLSMPLHVISFVMQINVKNSEGIFFWGLFLNLWLWTFKRYLAFSYCKESFLAKRNWSKNYFCKVHRVCYFVRTKCIPRCNSYRNSYSYKYLYTRHLWCFMRLHIV